MRTHCSVAGCLKSHYAKNLCRGHYTRSLRGQDITTPLRAMPSRIPPAFAEHGLTTRQVEYLIERGHIHAPLDRNGRRTWALTEVQTGILTYRLHAAGLSMEVAAGKAREYCGSSRSTLHWDLGMGIHLRLSVPSIRSVGRRSPGVTSPAVGAAR